MIFLLGLLILWFSINFITISTQYFNEIKTTRYIMVLEGNLTTR